jgi:RNA polymerase sigma-70 factor (ECF subfamily)
MGLNSIETEELLRRAGNGDDGAVLRLLERHRNRLRRVVAARLDRRVSARLDPSDVVQEALGEASEKLAGFLRDRPIPFYSWLRRLVLHRLNWAHRFHLGSGKRTVAREVSLEAGRSNGASAATLRLPGSGTSPSDEAVRDEECQRVRAVLARLGCSDRAILELRYVERLSLAEIAERSGIGSSAVKMRHLRALKRFCALLEDPAQDKSSPASYKLGI